MEDIKVDVKLIAPSEKKVKEVSKKASPPKIAPSNKHGNKSIPVKTTRSSGTVTLIALDASGNDKGNEFNVPEKEYGKYYSDETKFKVKKKAI